MQSRFLRSIGFFAASLALGLVLAEALVRLMVPDATRASLVERLKNERVNWARPDAEFHHVGDGIHQLAFPKPGAAQAARILVIGDSFAMGERVGKTKRFGTLLQQHLGEGAQVDVLAVTGYSPVIYRNILRKAFELATYHAVVISLDQTDPVDDLIYEEDVVTMDPKVVFDMNRMADRDKALNSAYSSLLEHLSRPVSLRLSALYNLFRPPSIAGYFDQENPHYTYVARSLERPQLIGQFILDPRSDLTRRMEALLTRHLDHIVSECRGLKVPVFMFANPWEFETAPYLRITLGLPGPFPKENRLEGVLLERYGSMPDVHVIRMTEYMRAQPNPSQLYVDNPGHEFHWNAKGHAVAEAILRRELLATLQLKP